MDTTKITVEIRRSSIWLYPYSKMRYDKNIGSMKGTCPELDRHLSVFDFGTKRYSMPFEIYDKKNKILKIPRGFGSNKVIGILRHNGVDFKVIDSGTYFVDCSRKINVNPNSNFKPKDEWQSNSINFLVNSSTDPNSLPQKLLTLDTGIGKTFCTIMSIVKLNCPAIIISPNLSTQWGSEILKYTDADEREIYYIKGTDSILRLLKKKVHRECFYLASTMTIISYMNRFGVDKLNELLNKLNVGIKVFDEIHMQTSSNLFIDTNSDVAMTVYLTATPGRSDPNEDRLFKELFHDINSYGFKTHFIKNYYNIRLVDYDTNASDYQQRLFMTQKGFSGINYFEYIMKNPNRRLYIYSLIKIFSERILSNDKDAKILIFMPRLEDIENMKSLIGSTSKHSIGNYTSVVKRGKERDEEKLKSIIFTTIGSGSTGTDIKNLRAIFLFTPVSSPVLSRQILGRLRYIPDKSVYLYDFIDRSVRHMIHQRNKRMHIFGPRANKIESVFCSYADVKREMKETYDITI